MDTKMVKADVYLEYKTCDCGGEFERHGNIVLSSYPPQYPHRCNKCGNTKSFTNVYPRIIYKPINKEGE